MMYKTMVNRRKNLKVFWILKKEIKMKAKRESKTIEAKRKMKSQK